MPQETKLRPGDAEDGDLAPGVRHENLEGWVPAVATPEELRAALEKAFDYRGDVTITRKDGTTVEGYVFDRRADGPALARCRVRLLPKAGGERVSVSYAEIARLEFTGRDTAAGKSWETWVRKYQEKKKAGETNIRIDPERLD
jgi:hypothetical protein